MKYCVFVLLFCLALLSGCYQSPEKYISKIDKGDVTEERILQELELLSNSDDYGIRDKEAAIYNYAFTKGYVDIAMTGFVESGHYVKGLLEYGPKDVFIDSTFKEKPLMANYGYAETLRTGDGLPQDDFKSLYHFIIAALMGSHKALDHMHGIYKEYDCGFQVAFIEKLGGSEAEVRGVSYGYKYSLTAEQKINVQKKSVTV